MKSLHKYMRAIGFSKYKDTKSIRELLTDAIKNADERAYTINPDDVMIADFKKSFGKSGESEIGISVCGEFDDEDKFGYSYFYPYLKGTGITTAEDVSVERHASEESYAGVCEDMKVGIALIFYLQNMIPYIKAQYNQQLPIKGTTVTLSAMSISGSILLPVKKEQESKKKARDDNNRNALMKKAKEGDEEAIETLTLEDIDKYANISKRIKTEDIYSMVDSTFMPYGVECDQYSILGEIINIKEITNEFTGENIYILTVNCNDLTFDICINKIDLFGEPEIGRRFKGSIWLQGYINFPIEYQ